MDEYLRRSSCEWEAVLCLKACMWSDGKGVLGSSLCFLQLALS